MPYYKNGVPVTTAKVGDTLTYDIPGHSHVYVYGTKDGQTQTNGPVTLPVPPFTLQSWDVGQFQTYSYELVGDTWGTLIESTHLDVSVAGAVVGDTSNLLLYGGIAVAAFLLLRR